MAGKKYTYLDENKNTLEIELSEELEDWKLQAEQDYKTSFSYIQKNEYFTWRNNYKTYHMSVYDRQVALGNNSWKQNISIGLIRSFCDVLISATNEKPITFGGTGINEQGIANKDKILKTLNYISDRTGFHKQIKKTLKDGIITGQFCLRVGYKKTRKSEKICYIVNDKSVIEEEEVEEFNVPYATNVSIFNIFPDPYTGPLRHITERGVVGYSDFIQTFGHMIRSSGNESPFKSDKFLVYLPINDKDAIFDDYGNIVTQIHEKFNLNFKSKDSFLTSKTAHETNTSDTIDQDKNVTKGLIEFKITYYKGKTVLIANGYPVYIGKNLYGFIPYVVKASSGEDVRFGEGIPALLAPLEEVGNSFLSNYFDSARSIANPTIVAQKNLLINDWELEDGTPGGVLRTESNDQGKAVYRLEKGGLNDFNIMPILIDIATRITGISEYNLGIASGERTAAGAISTTQSSQKRLSPYISNFLDALSIVAIMWLSLVKKFWTKEEMIYINGEDGSQLLEKIKNLDVLGGINISLQSEGMFGSYNELEVNKLINMYNTLAGSGFIQSPELAKEIIKKSGFEPSRFITEPGEGVIPEQMNQNTGIEGGDPEMLNKILKEGANPQIDLGNKGKGNK